jgi:hypothetical protein
MHPQQRTARLAGLLYLVVVFSSPFVLMYAPGKLFVAGDPSATLARIQANLDLLRAYILVGLVSEVFFVATVLTLYRLFRDVDRDLAALMVVAVVLIAPLALLGIGYEVATLRLLTDPQPLAALDPAARDALILLLPMLDRMATPVHVLFWGLWLLPLAILAWKSHWLPRWLAIWLGLNGLAYVSLSVIAIFSLPLYRQGMSISTPVLFGEAILALWLAVLGVRERSMASGSRALR